MARRKVVTGKNRKLKKGFQHAKRSTGLPTNLARIMNYKLRTSRPSSTRPRYLIWSRSSRAMRVLAPRVAGEAACSASSWRGWASQPPWAICLGGALVRSLYAFATFMESPTCMSGGAGRRANSYCHDTLMIFGAILDKDLRDQRGTKQTRSDYAKLRTTRRRMRGASTPGLCCSCCLTGSVGHLCRFHEMLRDFGTSGVSGRRPSCPY